MRLLTIALLGSLLLLPGGGVESSYFQTREYALITSSTHSFPAAGNIIDFDTLVSGNFNSSNVGSSGIITLTPGFTYKIKACITSTGTDDGYGSWQIYVNGGSALGVLGWQSAPAYNDIGATKQFSPQQTAVAYYTATSDNPAICVKADTSHEMADIFANNSFLSIEQVGGAK